MVYAAVIVWWLSALLIIVSTAAGAHVYRWEPALWLPCGFIAGAGWMAVRRADS